MQTLEDKKRLLKSLKCSRLFKDKRLVIVDKPHAGLFVATPRSAEGWYYEIKNKVFEE